MRILMFVPGHKNAFIKKAKDLKRKYKNLTIIYDLEDSVPQADKKTAYENTLKHAGSDDWVRVDNNMPLHELDSVDSIVIPKATPYVLERFDEFDKFALVPIIETAGGLEYTREIAERAGAIIFGQYDLAVSMHSDEYAEYAAQRIVTACRAFDIQSYQSPHYSMDSNVIAYNAYRAYSMGFYGMCVLHPDHIKVVNKHFKPSVDEIDWAESILKGAKDGISVHYNTIIGPPVLKRARQILK